MIPGSKVEILQVIKDIGINVAALNMVEKVDPRIVEFDQICDIEQFTADDQINKSEIKI